MNWEQLKGVVERVATIALTWFVAKGWVPAAVSPDIVAMIVLAGSVIWGFVVNTGTSLAAAAASTK